ncbi:MAG: HNH endonuclease [Gemmobacter sp.]
MNFLEYMKEVGASCNNPRHTWSYVNYSENFVVFTEWEHERKNGDPILFSPDFRVSKDSRGRKNAAYDFSRISIDLVQNGGFELRVVTKTAVNPIDEPLQVKNFRRYLERRTLIVDGDVYRAGPFSPVGASSKQQTLVPIASRVEDELWEGGKFSVLQVGYERSVKARKKCIAHYGAVCSVCEMNFDSVYGEIADSFVHVHHLVPISCKSGKYVVDYVNDLRPVCANCHAMLHKKSPPIEIELLKEMMIAQKLLFGLSE